MTSDLLRRPAVELAALIRGRELSPVELLDTTLERIERDNPRLNALVTVDADGARRAARAAEGRAGDPSAPPFDGVPIAIKDLHLTAGMRTTLGTRDMSGFVPAVDEEHVARLRRAGFVVVGKTNVPELGTLPVSESALLGACRNPWNLDRTPGGSSGGAAAALAGGLVPAANGSDGAGSIRIPASNCGLLGLKPSRGRVSNAPFGDVVASLGTAGPLARTVADLAGLLDVLRGYALGDAVWTPDPPRPYADEITIKPGRLRVGLVTTGPIGSFSSESVRAADAAAALLESLGHMVEPFTLPVDGQFKDDFQLVWASSVAALPLSHDSLEPYNAQLAALGREFSAVRLLQASMGLQLQARAIVTASDAYDVVLCPTLMREPLVIGELAPLACDAGAMLEALANYIGLTPLANVTGQPSVNLPLARSSSGLPLGIMATGRPGDEATLLRLAAQLEREHGWTGDPPPLPEVAAASPAPGASFPHA